MPSDRKVIRSKWVFRAKKGADGAMEKFKVHLVTKGFTQVEGVDYNKTFVPVVKFTSLQMLLALAAEMDLEIHQLNVKTAYLNGILDEELYLEPPEGFKPSDTTIIWKLNRSLYGLKQAGRVWYECMHSKFISLGFAVCQSDPCVFIKRENDSLIIVAIYVDDMLIFSSSTKELLKMKELLKRAFKITDLGEAS